MHLSLDTYLESSLPSVDRAEEQVTSFAQQVGFDEETSFQLGLAIREAMVNAVVHGNRYSSNKRVHLEVHRKGHFLEVRITDEGEGFQPEQQPDPLADENLLKQSGRGIMIIRAFVDEFVVQPGAAGGTEVILRKSISAGNPVPDPSTGV